MDIAHTGEEFEHRLLCASCGEECLHRWKTDEGSNFWDDSVLEIHCYCEHCPDTTVLQLVTHKGSTYLSARVLAGTLEDPDE